MTKQGFAPELGGMCLGGMPQCLGPVESVSSGPVH